MPGVTPKGFRRFTNDEKREFVRLLHEVESVRGGRAALLRRWGVDKSTVQRWLDAYTQQPEIIQTLEQRFTALHESLLRDTPRLAADAIEKVLAKSAG